MKGKVGLVIGLAAGYVLGTRAGRERYEQIKSQAAKVWNLDPVQQQVGKVTDFAKSSVAALPSTIWDAGQKVVKAVTSKDSTPGQKVDAAVKTVKKESDNVAAAAATSARAVRDAADEAIDDVSKAARDHDGA